jgi:hypothetical protein
MFLIVASRLFSSVRWVLRLRLNRMRRRVLRRWRGGLLLCECASRNNATHQRCHQYSLELLYHYFWPPHVSSHARMGGRRDAPPETQQDGCHVTLLALQSRQAIKSLTSIPLQRTLSHETRTIPCKEMQNEKCKRKLRGSLFVSHFAFLIFHFAFLMLILMLPTFPLISKARSEIVCSPAPLIGRSSV